MAGNGSQPYRTQGVKLNAQWLKSAAKSLGMNSISTLEDIIPNVGSVASVTSSSLSTISKSARDIRRTNRPLQYLLEQNKYIKLGKRGIKNALADLQRGNFNNSERQLQEFNRSAGTGTDTFFGDESESSDAGESRVNQYISTIDTEALTGISRSIDRQTKYQLEVGRAQIDSMVAVASTTMTQNQKNSDAVIAQLKDINKGIQSIVAYNNENMTKYISSSMAFFESVGKKYQGKDSFSGEDEHIDPLKFKGGLNVDKYKELLMKQFKSTLRTTPLGDIRDIVDTYGDQIIANPLQFISKAVMKQAVPKAVQSALTATDKVFGSFMSEMLLQLGDKFQGNVDGGILGSMKRFVGKTININETRKENINRSQKITEDAVAYDGVSKAALTDEIPKYLRESTSYLRTIVKLLGGDDRDAINSSEILNRETGTYQAFSEFSKNLVTSINDEVIKTMNLGEFGKSMRAIANSMSEKLSEQDGKRLDESLSKFYLAAEKNTKGSINISDLSSGSEMANLLDSAGLDPDMRRIIAAAISGTVRNRAGSESFNESRVRAKRARNQRLVGLESDQGLLRTSNVMGTESSVDELLASVIYGDSNGRVSGRRTTAIAPTSLVGKLDSLEGILMRGINVKILEGEPFRGRAVGDSSPHTQTNNTDDRTTGPTPQQNNGAPTPSSDISDSEMERIIDDTLYSDTPQGKGKGSKAVINIASHAKQMMYYMMSGNTSLAYAEMGAMFGNTMSSIGKMANSHVIQPLKDLVLGKDEYDADGNKISSRLSIKDILRKDMHEIFSDTKNYLFGEGGKFEKGKGFFKEGFASWNKALFGDKSPEETKEDIRKKIQERTPDMISGTMTGGILGALVGGPVAGAVLGAATGFAKNSKGFQRLVFGNIVDEDGNVQNTDQGLISQQMQKYFRDNKADIIGGGTVGAIAGTLTGGGILGNIVGGPLAGALMGSGFALFKKSKIFEEMVYGKDDGAGNKIGGILNTYNQILGKKLGNDNGEISGRKLSGMYTIGAGAGLLTSLFTPIGPVGGAVLGLAGSMFASKDKFNEYLFGTETEDGKRQEGLLGRFTNTVKAEVLSPLKDRAIDFFDYAKDSVIDKILSPFLTAVGPVLHLGTRLYEKTIGKLSEKVRDAADAFKDGLKNMARTALDAISKPIKGIAKGIFGAASGLVGAGIRGVGGVADKLNRRASRKRVEKEGLDIDQKTIDSVREQYDANNSGFSTFEKYFDNWKETRYFHSNNRGETIFGTKAERAAKRAERGKRREESRTLSNQAKLISALTGGRTTEVTDENKEKALNAYKQSRQYKRGKGIAGFKDDDVFKLLGITPADATESENTKKEEKEALDIQKQELPNLSKIAVTAMEIMEMLRDQKNKRDEKKANSQRGKAEKDLGRELTEEESNFVRNKSTRGRLINDIQNSVDYSDINNDVNDRIERGEIYTGNEWDKQERTLRKGSHSIFNRTKRKAALEASKAFFDSKGNRRRALTENERAELDAERSAAWDKYQESLQNKKDKKDAGNFISKARRYVHDQDRVTGATGVNRLKALFGTNDQYATGGETREGYAVVGETRPEIVKFSGRERVLSGRSAISVNIENISKNAADAISEGKSVQNVNIVGQDGPITTYGTSAKLGGKTDNANKIEKALEKPNTLVHYSDIKKDNADYESGGDDTSEKKEGFLSKLFGDGGILSKIGDIAKLAVGGFAIFQLLKSDGFKKLLSGLGGALDDSVENIAWTAEGSNYEGGKNFAENAKSQVHRLGSLVRGDVKTFMLGEDGEADGMTRAFMRGGRQVVNTLLNGRNRGMLSTIKSAARHPFKALGSVGSSIAGGAKSIGSFLRSGDKVGFIKDALGNTIKNTDAYNQVNMVKRIVTGGNATDAVTDAMAAVNPKNKGLAGFFQKTKGWVSNLSKKFGGEVVGEAAENTAESLAREGFEKVVKEGTEEVAEAAIKTAGQKVVKEGAEEVVEASTKKGMLKTVLTWLKKGISFIVEALGKKVKGSNNKVIKKALSLCDNVIAKISNGLLGKLKNFVMDKIRKIIAFLTGTTAAVATGVGALGVLAKDGVFVCLGALNNSGKGGAARLFRCQQKDVDFLMQAISAAIGAAVETTPGTVIDIANEIYCALTGDDFICNIASVLYKALSSDENDAKLEQSQKAQKDEFEKYKKSYYEQEWRAYLEDNSLTEKDLSLNDYISGVEKGDITSKVKSFDAWNDSVNQTWTSKAWTSIKDGASNAWTSVKDGFTKVGDWITGGNGDKDESGKKKANQEDAVATSSTSSKGGKGGVPFYSQKDPRWANIPYASSTQDETMQEAGCGPTAVAMAVSGATGKNVLPTESAKVLQSVGARDKTGTNWNGIGKAASAYGISSEEKTNPNKEFIDSAVQSGKPVILSGASNRTGTPYTSEGHYLVVTGKDSNGNYIVNDPNSRGGSKRYNKDIITKDAAKAWKFGGRGPSPAGYMQDVTGYSTQHSAVMPVETKNKITTESTGTGVTAADVVGVAQGEVGYIEKSTNSGLDNKSANPGDNNYTKYGLYTGANPAYWCASFVCWCLYQAANQNDAIVSQLLFGRKSASCAALEAQFKKAGRFGDTPAPGDLIFFTTDRSTDGLAHHIGIVEYVDDKKVHTIEGNTSSGSDIVVDNGGCVARKSYTLGYKKIRGYGRPYYDGTSNFKAMLSDASLRKAGPTASSTGTSGKSTNIFTTIGSWFSEVASRTVSGLSSGEWDTDWSSWIAQQKGESTTAEGSEHESESSTATKSGNTSSNADISSAQLPGSDDAMQYGSTRQEQIYNYLRTKGYGSDAIYAIMGNFMQESRLDPKAKQSPGKGRGLAQWSEDGRFATLTRMATASGKDPYTLIPQLDFMDHEIHNDSWMNKRFRNRFGSVESFKNTTDIEDATVGFENMYEIAGKANMPNRIAYAKEFKDSLSNLDNQQTGGGKGSSDKKDESGTIIRMYSKDAETKARTADEYLIEEGDKGVDENEPTARFNKAVGGRGSASAISTRTRISSPIVSPQQTGGGADVSEIVNALKDIITILGVSSDKLDNLKLLSNIGTTNTNNITTVNTTNATTNASTRKISNGSNVAEKTTSQRYRNAEKIARG